MTATASAPPTAFSTRAVPWTFIGTMIDEPIPTAKAIKMAGLDFDVSLRRTQFEELDGSWSVNPDRLHICRNDMRGPKSVMGVGSTDYGVVQYRDAFAFLDKINPRVVAAGPLKDFKQAFMIVQHPTMTRLDLRLAGEPEPYDLYVVVRTSHDLSRAVEIACMGLNQRCYNELVVPTFTHGAEYRWSIKHVRTAQEHMHQAQTVIRNLDRWAEAFTKNAQLMVEMDMTIQQAQAVMENVLPERPRRPEVISSILHGWQHGSDIGFHNTGYGLVMAVSSYYEHADRGSNRTPQSRLLGVLEGDTQANIRKTMTRVMGLAQERRRARA